MTPTLTWEDYGAGLWWAVTVDGEYLRTDRGRRSLERPEPLEVE